MVMVNPGTSANSPLSPTTVTATAVAVVSTRPSGREAVTVMVCDKAPSSFSLPSVTSVLSKERRMAESSSRMVRVAELTGNFG